MATEFQFLQDLAVVTVIAALTTLLFQRLRFPLVFGLLAAGVIIGPHTSPFSLVQDEFSLRTLADLGIVLILFGLGLDFNLRGLRKVGGAAFLITLFEVLFVFWLGYEAGNLLGWSPVDSVFLGAMLSISSTAIIVSVLREQGRLDADSSRIIFAVLVLEDVVAVVMLALLSGYAATGDIPVRDALVALLRMTLFLLALLLFGLVALPRLADHIAERFRPEVLVLFVLAVALGGAALSAAMGFHVGLGAFVVGAVLSEAKRRKDIEERVRPVHDYFAAIFFVSIGTLVDFAVLADHVPEVLLLVAVIVVGKLVSGTAATFLAGYSPATSVAVGLALAQVGEFSFVIAALGLATGTMSPFLFPLIVGTAGITSFASPLLIRHDERISGILGRLAFPALRTYGSVYSTWMRSVRERPGPEQTQAVRRSRHDAIVAALLAALLISAAPVLRPPGVRFLEQEVGLDVGVALPAYWAFVTALLFPVGFEMQRAGRRWVEEAHRVRSGDQKGLGVRGVVQYSFVVAATVLLGLPLVIATRSFLAEPTVAAIWIGMVAGAVLLLWTQIRRLHRRIRESVGALLEAKHVPVSAPEALQGFLSHEFPLQATIEHAVVTPDAWARDKTVEQLGIRSTTGASIILIERDNGGQLIPAKDIPILGGDRLTLMGNPEQVASARALLARKMPLHLPSEELKPGRVVVPEDSPWIGKSLEELALRARQGLHVVLIQRGVEGVTNPGPAEVLKAHDVLVVLGTAVQIEAAAGAASPAPASAIVPVK